MAGKKILVADDSLTIQKVIRLALSGDGYEIQTVSHGNDAIEQASLFRPEICIIDVSLPGKDAYQIRQEFLSKPDLKNIPVIMMSSAFEKVDQQRMNDLGFSGHLIKPFDPSHLRSTLLSVATSTNKSDPFTDAIAPVQKENEFSAPELTNTTTIRLWPTPSVVADSSTGFSLEPTKTDIRVSTPKEYKELRSPDLPPLKMDPGMDDIQQLTKSTFEMSGLGQQDWGVVEPMKEESFPPLTQGVTEGFSNDPSTSSYSDPFPVTPGNLDSPTPSASGPVFSAEEVADMVKTLVNAEVAKHLEKMQNEIEARVKNLFEEQVKVYSENQMPDLAEKVIKDEIHRLLNEPPQ